MSQQPFDDAYLDTLLAATPPVVVEVTAPHSSSPWTTVPITAPTAGAARCYLVFDPAPAAYEVRFNSADTVGYRVPANTAFAMPRPLSLTGLAVAVRTLGGADVLVRALVSFPARG